MRSNEKTETQWIPALSRFYTAMWLLLKFKTPDSSTAPNNFFTGVSTTSEDDLLKDIENAFNEVVVPPSEEELIRAIHQGENSLLAEKNVPFRSY